MTLKTLGRRAVACKHWQWMPGMAVLGGFAGVDRLVTDKFGMVHVPDADAGMVPDLSDPATLGCLLALVRSAERVPALVVGTWMAGGWFVNPSRGGRPHTYPTEAEALVAALEAAP